MNQLFYAAESFGPKYFRHPGCQFAAYTARSPDKTSPNEDCAGWIRVSRESWVFMVADGLGGLPAGESASQLAVKIILQQLAHKESAKDVRSAILAGIDSANSAILQSGSGGATTLMLAELSKGTLRTYHIGDSMTLVTGQRGQLKSQTVSHSPTGYMEESGVLDEASAMLHEDRHLVSNVLGSDQMRLEIGPRIILSNFDTVVMASDGLRDNLSQEAIIDVIKSGPLDEKISQLITQCQISMLSEDPEVPAHPDDLTIITLRRSE